MSEGKENHLAVYRPTYRDPKTGELKHQAIWWYEFTFAGRRIRETSKSTRKTVASEAEKNRRLELERAYSGQGAAEPPAQRIRTVKAALDDYKIAYPINHRAKSAAVVNERAPHLERHLGSLLMPNLTEKRIMQYVSARKAEGGDKPVSNRTINMELSVLSRAVGSKFQVLWPRLKRLEENHDVGRALEPKEEAVIFDAASKNQSRLIYPFLYVLAWTGMRSDEARTLRWSQVNFDGGEIVVGNAKTEAGRGRRIPMGANLKAVIKQHAAAYASRAGAIQPGWYVFPLSNRFTLKDPARPIRSLRKAWESVREAAGVECRLHDLRHTFCTKLAEAGVPESTMLDIMGHVSTAMLRRYSHIRAQARRDAIDALELRQFPNGIPKDSPKVRKSRSRKSALSR